MDNIEQQVKKVVAEQPKTSVARSVAENLWGDSK